MKSPAPLSWWERPPSGVRSQMNLKGAFATEDSGAESAPEEKLLKTAWLQKGSDSCICSVGLKLQAHPGHPESHWFWSWELRARLVANKVIIAKHQRWLVGLRWESQLGIREITEHVLVNSWSQELHLWGFRWRLLSAVTQVSTLSWYASGYTWLDRIWSISCSWWIYFICRLRSSCSREEMVASL